VIYVLARDLTDALQWANFNGHAKAEVTYVGQSWHLRGTIVAETDRIVRTARAAEHPAAPELERAVEHCLRYNRVTETKDGLLVRQEL
jgi:hypothetical protein